MMIAFICIFVFIALCLLGVALGARKSAYAVLLAMPVTAILQYGYYPFLDEQGRADLLMWQLISLPILFTMCLGGSAAVLIVINRLKKRNK
jgi:hypothetical protein